MSVGLDYIKKKNYMRKKTDKMFLISDMEDNLQSWNESVRSIPGKHYAIGYALSGETDIEFKGEFGRDWKKLWKTVFITERLHKD